MYYPLSRGADRRAPVLERTARFGKPSTPVAGATAVVYHKVGTTFSFRLDRAATVKISIDKLSPGRRVNGVCRAPTPKLDGDLLHRHALIAGGRQLCRGWPVGHPQRRGRRYLDELALPKWTDVIDRTAWPAPLALTLPPRLAPPPLPPNE